MSSRRSVRSAASWVLPPALAVGVALLLLLVVGANPLEALRLIFRGALGGSDNLSSTLMAWVPLTLAAAGLVVTFAAGLWNIGVEGQIVMGAIAASWVARELPGPAAVVVPLTILAGLLGGTLWGLAVGALRVFGKVNEIFGGLGLDFVATGLAVYLIIGPWKRGGVASTSGTELFRREAWLPTIGSLRVSAVALAVASAAVVGVYFLMRGTLFGLRLRAVGRSLPSAFLLGIPTRRYMLSAFAICGALAGVAGAVHATGYHHKLVPAVSGGYGFLGILVVLLAGFRAAWIAPIAFFFAAISVGSTQLTLVLGLDSAVGGVLQGMLVLLTLLAGGWQLRRSHHERTKPTIGE
jgi:ABC-type uncharacterized transport system permease subunit